MSETGVDAVVLVSNRFAKKDEGEDVFDSCDIDIEDNDLTDITIE